MQIRIAHPAEYSALGNMLVNSYKELPGMPSTTEQPAYYSRLQDVAVRASNHAISIFVAVDESDELLGGVDFITDMKHYSSGGSAGTIENASGIRLLVVNPKARGMGIGKSLTDFCIKKSIELGKSKVILHTTKSMERAWAMYEKMGFKRFSEIDFKQGELIVYGFQLDLLAK